MVLNVSDKIPGGVPAGSSDIAVYDTASSDDTLIMIGPGARPPTAQEETHAVGMFCGLHWPEHNDEIIRLEAPMLNSPRSLYTRLLNVVLALQLPPTNFGVGVVFRTKDQRVVRAVWATGCKLAGGGTTVLIGYEHRLTGTKLRSAFPFPVDFATLSVTTLVPWAEDAARLLDAPANYT